MGMNMRFFAVIGICTAAELVTLQCRDCPDARRGTLTETNLQEGAKIACCTSGSLSSCQSDCSGCSAPDGCAQLNRRREVMSDDFDDLEQDISLKEGEGYCFPC